MSDIPLRESQKRMFGDYICPDKDGMVCAGCLARTAELKAGGPSNMTSICLLEKLVLDK
tara:strand:- start:968 stop:1144 length:177 start_codon:yes stop_codon:yes gene_type:complete